MIVISFCLLCDHIVASVWSCCSFCVIMLLLPEWFEWNIALETLVNSNFWFKGDIFIAVNGRTQGCNNHFIPPFPEGWLMNHESWVTMSLFMKNARIVSSFLFCPTIMVNWSFFQCSPAGQMERGEGVLLPPPIHFYFSDLKAAQLP